MIKIIYELYKENAIIKEYDITYDQIYAKGDSYKCFLAEHFRREFGSCLYALSRAGEEYLEYSIKEMSRAFNEYESKGFLDTSFIDEHQLCQLHEIMKKPEMAYKSFKNLGKEVSNKISGYNSFILYGAGVIGKRIFDCITDRDISKFLGFAVSNSNDIDVCAYKGYEIKAIDDYMNFRKDTAVVVAVTHKWREEICDRLDDLGFEHIIILDSMGADV